MIGPSSVLTESGSTLGMLRELEIWLEVEGSVTSSDEYRDM